MGTEDSMVESTGVSFRTASNQMFSAEISPGYPAISSQPNAAVAVARRPFLGTVSGKYISKAVVAALLGIAQRIRPPNNFSVF